MARLDLDNFDARSEQPLADFDPIPPGEYLALVADSDVKPNKAGTGSYLELVWEIVEGEHKGRRLWARLNLKNPNVTAVEIAKRELSAICRATGVMQPRDSAEFHHKLALLKVGIQRRKDTGEPTNRIRGYNAPPHHATPTNPPSSSTPPWQMNS